MNKHLLNYLCILLSFYIINIQGQQCAVFFDDFESNSILPHWTASTNTFYTTNIDVASGTYSLETNMNSQSLYDGMETYFTPSQPSSISYWVKTNNTFTTGAGTIIIGDSSTNNGGNTGMYFVNYFNGNLRVIGNTTHMHPATNNTWYLLEYKNIDWVNQSSEFYIDGTLIMSNFEFRNYFASINMIILSNGTFNSTGTTYSAWDDILIGGSSITTNENDTICSGESYTFPDGTIQNNIQAATINTSVLTASNFCDSIIITSLDITQVDTSVSQNGIELSANIIGATFQWVDCDNNYAAITNENNATFIATANGNYAVIIAENNCSDTSYCYQISTVGVQMSSLKEFQLYPNPSHNEININLGKIYQIIDINITNIHGQLIKTLKYANLEFINLHLNQSEGLYILHLQADDMHKMYKFVLH